MKKWVHDSPRITEARKVPVSDFGRIWDRVAESPDIIAAEYGVSRSRIYQIARGAMEFRRRRG